ncbi:MAG: DUF3014 domain-containing protein [Longimicrobiales bacterium]
MFTSRRSRRRSPGPAIAGVGILVVVVLGVGAWWLWLRAPEPPMGPVTAPVADTGTALPEEPFVLPELGASDAVVRRLVAGAAAHPQLAAWLVPDDLVRRFVEAVVDISRGSSPLPAMEVLIPEEPFGVRPSGDELIMDPRSQRRYDLLADVFSSVDPLEAAEVYRRLLPLFQEAYQELGLAEESFEEVLARAIDNLLAVEVPDGPLELRVAVGRYVYADPDIESRSPAEKHLIRMGPRNARVIQEKLRQIYRELDLAPVEGEGVGDTTSVEGGGGGG